MHDSDLMRIEIRRSQKRMITVCIVVGAAHTAPRRGGGGLTALMTDLLALYQCTLIPYPTGKMVAGADPRT